MFLYAAFTPHCQLITRLHRVCCLASLYWIPHTCSPLGSPDTLFALASFLVFAADLGLNFFVAHYDTHGDLVTDLHSIAGGLTI